ncbi:NAD-dependent epimerase/dehydratase family protein [Desulfatirhabdium butyrativorans]|uniref:NAD-dependent epimerase/dehydratase family protein n=1 Tax=Desulfatirhabdium butyrativorans TaxID=340467 RepID=UPI00040EFEEB|nr:NAD-dependent epimerase/dehydratase family protein [Desulfatirhabdium butyrativorans]
MNILVLGGAGFIGSHIVDALVDRGHRVRVFDLPNVNRSNLQHSLNAIEFFEGDFGNVQDTARALEGVNVLIHLICTTLPGPSNENPIYDVESNVIGTLNLLNEALKHGVQKIVFASSGGTVYGIPKELPIAETHPTDPICSYGITKLMIEKYLYLYHRIHGLNCTVLRFANPYGERQRITGVQGAIAVFLGKVLHDQPISIWGDGTVARDYFYIGDLVEAVCRVVEGDCPSLVYNIGSGTALSLNDMLEWIRRVTGKNPVVHYEPQRALDVPINCLDIGRAGRELGWFPQVSLEEGLERTWAWLKRRMADRRAEP